MTIDEPLTLPVPIRYEHVLAFLGYPADHRPPPRIEKRIRPLLESARELAAARGAYRHLAVETAQEVGLEPLPAAGLVIGLVTAGREIESRVTELLDSGAATDGLLLDAMGSVAAEEAADLLGLRIVGGVGADDAHAPPLSCRISPGYGRWPLASQTALFARLPHQELQIELRPSLLMVPRKSISFAMWMGADARPIAGLSGCEQCNLERCRYRTAREDLRA